VRDRDIIEIVSSITKRRIITSLISGAKYQSELVKEIGIRQQALVRHLADLEELGIIKSWTEANQGGAARRYYDLSQDALLLREMVRDDDLSDEFFTIFLRDCLEGPDALKEELNRIRRLERKLNKLIEGLGPRTCSLWG